VCGYSGVGGSELAGLYAESLFKMRAFAINRRPMTQKWYRGEGVGVAPSKPGGALHDFGDGLYLTDSEDVATLYAKTRAAGTEPRVLEVNIATEDLGMVLDLTSDSRWIKFMTRPMVQGSTNPHLSKSRLDYLKIKHELYHDFFEEFVRENKINIASYDSVIGPEYVRGGKQLCILSKKGLQLGIGVRIRNRLRPRLADVEFEFKPPAEWEPNINVVEREVMLRSGFRGAVSQAGEVALTLGIAVGLAILEYYSMKWAIEDKYKERIKDVGKKITERIKKTTKEIAKEQLKTDKGEKVYANAVVQVAMVKYSGGVGQASWVEPEVLLADLYVSTKPMERDRTFKIQRTTAPDEDIGTNRALRYPDTSQEISEMTRSYEVWVYTDEELEAFRDLTTAYLQYSRRAKMNPADRNFAEAVKEIKDQIIYTYGPDAWVFLAVP